MTHMAAVASEAVASEAVRPCLKYLRIVTILTLFVWLASWLPKLLCNLYVMFE